MSRLVVVSRRVAMPRDLRPDAIAATLRVALRNTGAVWFGWSGKVVDAATPPQRDIDQGLTFITLDALAAEHEEEANGFLRRTLWPLLHFRSGLSDFRREAWHAYVGALGRFADRLAELIQPADLVWIHDESLIPLAELLRERGVTARLGFFLHTPFPPWEWLRRLPVHRELYEALASYDLLGFNTDEYLRAFREYLVHEVGGQWSEEGSHRVKGGTHTLRAAVVPIGIDPDLVQRQALRAQAQEPCRQLAQSLQGGRLVIGVDRLDEGMGVAERLRAFDAFLDAYPELRGQASLLQIAPASRADARESRQLKRELESIAGSVNARHAQAGWTPVRYLSRPYPPGTLAGFFRLARVALVTPLRDGMNLVAKEYVAAQNAEDPGVLVLSRFAGAASELDAAVLVNPYDRDAVAKAVHDALSMPLDERRARWQAMIKVLRRNNAEAWRRQFLAALEH